MSDPEKQRLEVCENRSSAMPAFERETICLTVKCSSDWATGSGDLDSALLMLNGIIKI